MIVAEFSLSVLLLSAGILVTVTVLLVLLLLFIKQKLTPEGAVRIRINGDKELETERGGTVLGVLGENQIFLPSACGGGGSCGMCRCQVESGGGEILPTEKGFFNRKEVQDNWRLGCQVKIREDLSLKIPDEILGIRKWECEVISNNNVASFIKEFVVKLPEGEILNFKPGSYIQIDVPAIDVDFSTMNIDDRFRSEWDRYKLWDLKMHNPEPTYRAYSMANHPAEGNIIMLNIRIATPPFDKSLNRWATVNPGICSSYIFSRKPGDKVTLSGPFGEFHIQNTKREMLYIGGGAGMAPLRSHLLHLFHTLQTTDRKISYWYGARSKNEIFYEEDFRKLEQAYPNFSFHIALSEPGAEDQWTGSTGFIHQVILDEYLVHHEFPEDIEYYMCGPGPMAKAVQKMLDELGVPPEMLLFDDFGA